MNKYSEIEIETAKNMLKKGLKWIVRNQSGRLSAHACKPSKVDTYWWSAGYSECVCNHVPIFQSVRFGDKEPVSLERIVHPQILDDAEKRYLRAVIRPFRDRVKYIAKIYVEHVIGDPDNFIFIRFTDESADMNFPVLHEMDMYKGMEINRPYTPEELGL